MRCPASAASSFCRCCSSGTRRADSFSSDRFFAGAKLALKNVLIHQIHLAQLNKPALLGLQVVNRAAQLGHLGAEATLASLQVVLEISDQNRWILNRGEELTPDQGFQGVSPDIELTARRRSLR
jgi:predicted acetyltransferase